MYYKKYRLFCENGNMQTEYNRIGIVDSLFVIIVINL